MFPHLRPRLIALWTSSVAGTVVILNLTLGHSVLGAFVWAADAGLAIGIPVALLNWTCLRPNRARQAGVLGQVPPDRR